RVRIDELAVGQQLEAEYVDLFLGLLALTYDVAEVVVGKARFDTIGGVVGQRQGNGPGRGDRAVVGKARALLGQRLNQCRVLRRHLLHVAAVFRPEHLALDLLPDLETVLFHFRALGQHGTGNGELLFHQRRRAFFLGQLQTGTPALHRHFPGDTLGELQGLLIAVLHAQHGHGRTQAEEAHAVAALAEDLVALLFQRQAVDLHHVV